MSVGSERLAEQRALSAARPGGHREEVRLRLLGGFELTVGGRSWDLPPAAARLVAFLALQSRPLMRSHVAGALWGDRSENRAGACLRSAIWRVNGGRATPVIQAGRTRIALNGVSVDAHEAAGAAHTQLMGGSPVSPQVLSGELLRGWYDDWVIVERERLRQLCLEGMEQMAQSLLRAELWHRAIEAAMFVVATEPLREAAHRVIIEAQVGAGNRGEALRQFTVCRELLVRELGLEPGPALQAAAARAREA
ncbi:BTAD domain-containing putative transcriptional regulator [Cellulomonas sp. KRMCY2]|uniref:AfsR/SARP family transcriptional regulator n=1 Tax=Cellulomonas sp. KRMCY2 TaxID=1304865 RepID=UPI00045EA665|nr:BTAD domain-containing putative transcriptional regulator [Cellulomonas sp. KRMCY2]